MKKINIILLTLIISASSAMAQKNLMSATYTVGFATGDLKTFIDKTSWRGFTLDYRSMIDENIGIGFEVGWNAWYNDEGYQSFTDGSATVSGTQYRYASTVPMLIDFDYYLMPGEKVNPFVGFGIGTEFTRADLDMGLYNYEKNSWAFALKAEAGINYQLNPGTGITISGRYYNGFKTVDLNNKTSSYIALNVGLVWMY